MDLQRAARVVHHRRHVRPVQNVAIHTGEVVAHREDGGLDLDHMHARHAGDVGQSARRDAAAVPDDERGARVGPCSDWSEPEQDLGVHVAVIGRVRLAVDLEGAADAALPHAHGGVPPFLVRQLPHAPMIEEYATLVGGHVLAPVDGGPRIDEPCAPARSGHGRRQPHACEPRGGEQSRTQPAVLR